MAVELPGFSWTLVAGATIVQFTGVDVQAATGLAVGPTGAGARIVGVCQNKPLAGHSTTIVSSGITKGLIGTGGVTAGQNVAIAADGRFVTAATGNRIVGVALKTNAAGTLGTILLGAFAAALP